MDGTHLNPVVSIEHVVLIAAAITAFGLYCAWRSSVKCPRRSRAVILAARLAALIALVLPALNPGSWRTREEERKGEWALIIDRSRSMATADVRGNERWREALRLADEAMGQTKNPGDVRVYTFTDSLEDASAAKLEDLEPDGDTTDILAAGEALLNRYRTAGRTLTGVLLMSDGRQILRDDFEDLAMLARSRESEFFAVALGGEVRTKDLIVRAGRKQYVGFKGQAVTVGASVAGRGLGKIRAPVELADATGVRIKSKTVELDNDEESDVSFVITPPEPGYFEYLIRSPDWPGESIKGNNEAILGITVLEERIRVLFVEGTPFWDSKFLTQLLREQPNIQVTSIYRVAADRFFRVESAGK